MADIPFKDNKGNIITIPEETTIRELVEKYGVKEFEIVKDGMPIKDGWFRECGDDKCDVPICSQCGDACIPGKWKWVGEFLDQDIWCDKCLEKLNDNQEN